MGQFDFDVVDEETGEVLYTEQFRGNALVPAPPEHPVGGPVMTKQSDALMTDINAIVSRYTAIGMPLPQPGEEPRYGDFSSSQDYHAAASAVREAEADFLFLPAAIRDACANDVGVYLDKIATPEGREELAKVGLVKEQLPPDLVETGEVKPGAEPPSTS